MAKQDKHPWAVGMKVVVMDTGMEVYRRSIAKLTTTQVVTSDGDRWRRHDGSLIDPVYYLRTIKPVTLACDNCGSPDIGEDEILCCKCKPAIVRAAT